MSGSNALASVFDNANKPTVAIQSPFEVMNQAGDVASKLNANRLFQANTLRGQLIQQATDANGNVDMPTYNRLAAGAGPGLAPAAAAGLDQSTKVAGQQQDQAGVRNAYLGQQLGALLDLPDEQLNSGLAATAGRIRDSRLFPPGEIDHVLSHLPNDPGALRTQLRQVQLSLQAPAAQQGQTYGTTSTQTGPGGVTIGTVQQPAARGGGVSAVPQPGAPQGPSADSLSAESTIIDSNGVPHTDTKFGHIQNGRITPMGAPAPGFSAGSAAQPGNPAAGTGANQQPDNGPNPLLGGLKSPPGTMKDKMPSASPTPSPAGGTTGPKPGLVAGADANATQSVAAFKDVSDQGVAARSRGAVLDNILSDTKQFTSGPGADALLKLRQIRGSLGMSVDTDATSASESFTKLVAQLNSAQGAGSDARLSVAEAGNVHKDLSPGGVDLMVRQLRGNEDYLAARAKLAAAYPDKTDKTGFEAKQGSQLDPRTFQYDRMTDPQKRTYFKNIGDKDAFIKAHDAATALLGGR